MRHSSPLGTPISPHSSVWRVADTPQPIYSQGSGDQNNMKPIHTFTTLLGLLWLGLALPATAMPTSSPVDPELRALLKQAASETESFADRFEAEVWLMDMSQRLAKKIPDSRFRIELLKPVHHEATRAGLKPELVLSVIEVESNFNRFAISSAGARGLMQVMPFWF